MAIQMPNQLSTDAFPGAQHHQYIMRDQARNTVRQIMNEDRVSDSAGADKLVTHPSWLALGLLLVAFNIVTVTAP